MELIDNVNKTLKDDLTVNIKKDSKVSIAAACFSIYAFQELKRELKNVDELRYTRRAILVQCMFGIIWKFFTNCDYFNYRLFCGT